MLIDKPIEKNKITTMKLATGEELIAKILEDTEHTMTLAKPLSIIMSDKGLAMIPYMLSVSADDTVVLQKRHCICTAKPVSEVEKHYLQVTTGISL